MRLPKLFYFYFIIGYIFFRYLSNIDKLWINQTFISLAPR